MPDKMWFSVFLIRLILASMGIALRNDALRYLNHITLALLFNSSSMLQQIIFLSKATDTSLIWITVNNLVHNMNYFATWIILYLNRKSLINIMSSFQINIHRYPDFMAQFKPPERVGVLPTVILLALSYASYFFILLAPLVFQIVTKAPPSLNGLMYPCWYPWTIDSQLKYAATYTLQLISGLLSCYFMPCNIVFVMHFVFILQEQREILYEVLRNIKNHRIQNECEFRRSLIECMKHHSALIKFIGHFVSCYKWIFVLNLLYSTMVFTINCYMMITGDHNLAKFAQTTFELLIVFPYFFVYCYIGEIFKDVNNVMKLSIYDINWYEKSLKFRKLVVFLLSLTTPEINLKFSPHSVASYALFASVIRSSYTYANLMLNMQRKRAYYLLHGRWKQPK